MDTLKCDSALSAKLATTPRGAASAEFDVSVRTRAPLSAEQAAELEALGVSGADTRRSIFAARLSARTVRAIAAKPWVACVFARAAPAPARRARAAVTSPDFPAARSEPER